MKHVFIINPVSGKKNVSVALRAQIRQAAQQLGLETEVINSKYKGHCTELARQWVQWAEEHSEIVRLYSCGGDGTLNEVLMGAKGCPLIEVACVPCGSGNDFIRNYGSNEDFLDLPSLMSGKAQTIDMIETNAGWSASICAAGLDAQVAYGIPKYRRIPLCGGSMAYYLSIVEQLCGKMGKKLSIDIDGEHIEQDCLLLAICNGSYYGGGFFAAPEASMNDGMLDVVIVKKINRLRIAKVLDVYKKGAHLYDGQVREDLADILEFYRGREIHVRVLEEKPIIATLDGECTPLMELHAAVVENCVKVVVPQKLLLKQQEPVYAE